MDRRAEIIIPNGRGAYGVEVSRFASDRPVHAEQEPGERHLIMVQLSGPVGVTTRFGRRRLRHRPRRSSIGIAPGGTDCSVDVDGPLEGIMLSVSAECLALAAAQTARHGGALVERLDGEDDYLFDLARVLDTEATSSAAADVLSWSSGVDALFRHLAERHLTTPADTQPGPVDPHVLRRLDDYIRANLAEPLDLPSLAAVAGCDQFRFARAFRRATGLTPHRYVTRLRLERARALMRSGTLPLADVSLAAGFCDQSHLSRWMRRVYGETPGVISGRRRACKNVQDR